MNTAEASQEKRSAFVCKGVLKSSSVYSDLRSEGYDDMGRDLIFLPRSALPKGGITQ